MTPLKILTLALCSLATVAQAQVGTVFLTTHELAPYSYLDEHDQRPRGIAVAVVECVLTRMEVPYRIKVTAWARAQKLVQDGVADGFFAGSRNAERDAFAVQSATIADQQWRWYLLADNPVDPSTTRFRKRASVSSFIGANMLDWLIDNDYRVASPPRDTEGLLKMLQAKRVDAILANNKVMDNLLQQQGLDNSIRSVLLQDKPLGVYFSKTFLAKQPGFLDQFNSHVAACRAQP
jgi:polar amino acid transport system substrate-binding protein